MTIPHVAPRAIASFIIRMWLEPADDDGGAWRGQVEHVQSGERSYFQDLRKLQGFVATHLPVSGSRQDDSAACGATE